MLKTWRGAGCVSLRFRVACAVIVCVPLCGCGDATDPTGRHMDAQLMAAETSAIPGAQAKVLAGGPATAATSNFCVTQAGYCPLAAAAPAGENCVCQAAGSAYGGATGAAPQTIKDPYP